MSEQLKLRTKAFALDVIRLCAGLPRTVETGHAIGQVIRSSSSVAANYRAACRGRSPAQFIAKLGIVEEEADESVFWLDMLSDLSSMRHPAPDARSAQELVRLRDEADQLLATQCHRGKQRVRAIKVRSRAKCEV